MSTSRTRAMVLLATAFGLGMVVGGAGMALAARSGKVDIPDRGTNGRGGPGWLRELKLDDAQRDTVMAIYRRDEKGIDSVMRRIRPQTDSLFDLIRPEVEARRTATRQEVRTLLTLPQQEKYDSMVKAYDEQRKRMREQSRSGAGRSRAGH